MKNDIEQNKELNYYNELIEEIKLLVLKKDLINAEKLIMQELKMPYTPQEIEQELIEIFEQIVQADEKIKAIIEFDEIEKLVQSPNFDHQIIGIQALRDHNLRTKVEWLENLYERQANILIKNLILEIMIEQQIDVKDKQIEIPEQYDLAKDQTFNRIRILIEELNFEPIYQNSLKENFIIMMMNNLHYNLEDESIINILLASNEQLFDREEKQTTKLTEKEEKVLSELYKYL